MSTKASPSSTTLLMKVLLLPSLVKSLKISMPKNFICKCYKNKELPIKRKQKKTSTIVLTRIGKTVNSKNLLKIMKIFKKLKKLSKTIIKIL